MPGRRARGTAARPGSAGKELRFPSKMGPRGSKDNATGRHKSVHYQQLGYAFASIDYRLVPGATVEQQAQDVADAVAAAKEAFPAWAALGAKERARLMAELKQQESSAAVSTMP